MTWKPDPRTERSFGPYRMVSERDGHLTSHLVTFPDGRQVRVLPDDRTSGQKRSRVATQALRALGAASDETHGYPLAAYVDEDGRPLFNPVAYLVGCLAVEGIRWELVSAATVTVEDTLADWFRQVADAVAELDPGELIRHLAAAGFEIVRKEGS